LASAVKTLASAVVATSALMLHPLQVDAYAELPYFMNPLLAACQLVNVSLPGAEPPLAEAQEDMRLFTSALQDKQGVPAFTKRLEMSHQQKMHVTLLRLLLPRRHTLTPSGCGAFPVSTQSNPSSHILISLLLPTHPPPPPTNPL
jgi:hypothetical protein